LILLFDASAKLAAALVASRLRLVVEVDGLGNVHVLRLVLLKCGDSNSLESLLNVNGFLGTGLVVGDRVHALGLAPCLCLVGGDTAFVLLINLVAKDDEWEIFGVTRTSLDEDSSLQLSSCSKDFWFVMSYTNTQASAPR